MNGPQHILIGIGSAIVVNHFTRVLPYSPLPLAFVPISPLPMAMISGAALVGALLPDIDHNNSTIRVKTGTARGKGPLGVFGWIGGILAATLGGHRAFTHTGLCFALLAWAVLHWTPVGFQAYALAFLVGYASHIVADMLTEGGVPLLWPLSSKRIGLWR